ncbi:MAG: radical SAM protein [Coriobacteriia bacterium]|nr:radical SAM protein [Coriobacteriia bacterium]
MLYIADDFARKLLRQKPILHYLEYHVASQCNMNCKGCFHFSNLVDPDADFPSLEQFRQDIKRLSILFGSVSIIRLVGGEPLLNPQLPQFISATREAFPKAKIALLSNGLRYKKIEGELLDVIKSADAEVQISLYQPMLARRDKMKRHFEQVDIRHHISDSVDRFAKYVNMAGDSDPHKSVRQCPASRCTFLGAGSIARCPLPFNIEHFNRNFNQNIDMAHEKLDIHDPKWDGFTLKKILRKPMDSCRYCGKLEWFDWQQAKLGKDEIAMQDYCSVVTDTGNASKTAAAAQKRCG